MLERACSRLDSISWKLLSAPPTNRATNFPIGLIGDPCAGDIIVRRGLEFLLDGKRGWKNGTKRGGGGYACIKLRRKVVEMDIKGRMEGNEEGGREWRVKKARLGYTRFFFQRFPNLLNPSPSRAITHSEFLFLFLLLSSFFISEHEKLFLLLEAARFFFAHSNAHHPPIAHVSR